MHTYGKAPRTLKSQHRIEICGQLHAPPALPGYPFDKEPVGVQRWNGQW